MEVASIIYKAKDGRLFYDPLECEEYEKAIGILPGTVGALIVELEKLEPTEYVFGLVLVNAECPTIYSRCTVCCDNLLEDYVNPNNLTEKQRYISETVGNFIEELKKINKDYPCQYMLMHSHSIRMFPSALMANYNKSAWGEQNDK